LLPSISSAPTAQKPGISNFRAGYDFFFETDDVELTWANYDLIEGMPLFFFSCDPTAPAAAIQCDLNDACELMKDNSYIYPNTGEYSFTWPMGDGEYTMCLQGYGDWYETDDSAATLAIAFDYSDVITVVHSPSPKPTSKPSRTPTPVPSPLPTLVPTPAPTPVPTAPTSPPTPSPSPVPSYVPTSVPSPSPTHDPTKTPVSAPTPRPTGLPSSTPTQIPSISPTVNPTVAPSHVPTPEPTYVPTSLPTASPSHLPSPLPTSLPTIQPSLTPTHWDVSTVNIKFQMTSSNDPTAEDESNIKASMMNAFNNDGLGVPKIMAWLMTSFSSRRLSEHNNERKLVSTWEISCDIQASLSDTDATSSSEFASMITSAITSDSFTADVSSTTSATVDTSSVESFAVTRSPSLLPSPLPTIQPSSEPTHLPTKNPLNEPTSLPISAPTPRPSKVKTTDESGANAASSTFIFVGIAGGALLMLGMVGLVLKNKRGKDLDVIDGAGDFVEDNMNFDAEENGGAASGYSNEDHTIGSLEKMLAELKINEYRNVLDNIGVSKTSDFGLVTDDELIKAGIPYIVVVRIRGHKLNKNPDGELVQIGKSPLNERSDSVIDLHLNGIEMTTTGQNDNASHGSEMDNSSFNGSGLNNDDNMSICSIDPVIGDFLKDAGIGGVPIIAAKLAAIGIETSDDLTLLNDKVSDAELVSEVGMAPMDIRKLRKATSKLVAQSMSSKNDKTANKSAQDSESGHIESSRSNSRAREKVQTDLYGQPMSPSFNNKTPVTPQSSIRSSIVKATLPKSIPEESPPLSPVVPLSSPTMSSSLRSPSLKSVRSPSLTSVRSPSLTSTKSPPASSSSSTSMKPPPFSLSSKTSKKESKKENGDANWFTKEVEKSGNGNASGSDSNLLSKMQRRLSFGFAGDELAGDLNDGDESENGIVDELPARGIQRTKTMALESVETFLKKAGLKRANLFSLKFTELGFESENDLALLDTISDSDMRFEVGMESDEIRKLRNYVHKLEKKRGGSVSGDDGASARAFAELTKDKKRSTSFVPSSGPPQRRTVAPSGVGPQRRTQKGSMNFGTML